MKYSRFIAGLILIMDLAIMEKEKSGVKWGINLEYVTLCSIIVLITGFGIDIWKTFKDRKDSRKEHEGLRDNQNKNKDLLEKDHQQISGKIDEKHGLLSNEHSQLQTGQTRISQTTSEIRSSVHAIDKQLAVEKAHREDMLKNMTDEQKNVHNQINAVYALNQQLPQLRYEKQQLSEKYVNLQHKYRELQKNHSLLLNEYQSLIQENQKTQQKERGKKSRDYTQDRDDMER